MTQFVPTSPSLQGVDLRQLSELAHRRRYAEPTSLFGYTGVAVAGYGVSEIFPGYCLVHVHGHIGNELFFTNKKSDRITHAQSSLIVPLAQKSMIDLFTDGFGFSLWSIILQSSEEALGGLAQDIVAGAGALPGIDLLALAKRRHDEFMQKWTRRNWDDNYNPLMGVLTALSVEELAHLAETLLLLQSLKERVTSASEEVGGPIDVAAITKSEGLVWLKRKHFFDASLNARYLKRVNQEI